MAADDRVVLVTERERREGDPTPGMVREQAIVVDGMWAGFVRTEAHMTSGWHHHGDHNTAAYLVDGRLRMEFGRDGRGVIEAGPGDFVHVPKGVVHRESNAVDHESHVVVVRAGTGPPTINVPGPPATTREGTMTTLEAERVSALADRLRGRLIQKGDDGYEAGRRLHNGMIDKRPALIARCRDAGDVIAAVEFARDERLGQVVRVARVS